MDTSTWTAVIAMLILGIGLQILLPAVRWVGWALCASAIALVAYGYIMASSAQPDVTLNFVTPKQPAVWIENVSDTLAENIKWQFMMFNLDDPSNETGWGNVPIRVRGFDFLKPHQFTAGHQIFDDPLTAAAVRPGNRLFGHVLLSCARCVRDREYWVWITVGEGGWSSELPEGGYVDHAKFKEAFRQLMKSADPDRALLNSIPAAQRVAIKD
jgi:hypothetical protein